ncbi:unnamed protein product [Urochloa decumbens]|uniref:Uncharacterized protein n=1 Tax=Urochloa decumbens TaxID=240449 RepID=A0ABC9B1E8_9POAL
MSKEAAVNACLSCFMHVGLALVLLVYVPVASLCRLLARVFVRPFARGEDLRGKVVLVTGASSGIGEHLVYEYARKGACVALVARTEIALRAVAKTARDLGAPDVLVVPADITKVDEAKRAVEETVAHFGKLNHLVANAGIWSSCFFEEITNITAFHNVIASKGAVIRFYETLRAELGSHVRVTILMPGYVVSNLTKGKGLQKDGNVGIDEEARDINVGPLPVGKTESLAAVVVASVRRGDYYVTWPGWYWPFHMVMCAAPELVDWFSRSFYVSKSGEQDGGAALSKKILEAVGGKKFLYPKTIRSQAAMAAN